FYRFGVLVDMVGDANLELYYERNSLRLARTVTRQVWQSAKVLREASFVPRPRHEISDDHLPLNEIARVPTTNLVDFDYPKIGSKQSYWHTEADTADKCSPESLQKVGRVLLHWLQTQQ
ncbi:MAG: M28 family peptidase, partial [Planctomycetota bacterium]|nr:M28 family peptidase [Planctomycetota bacterium]MED5286620.1 M28 family peptidase [Planctomycetota bacterium]